MRIGHGYDVHRLVEGRDLILGGVKIDYELGLLGHSDADVLLHAVSDALLGAAGLGDIGKHFPDTDPKYKGADSLMLLREVGEKIRAAGYRSFSNRQHFRIACKKTGLYFFSAKGTLNHLSHNKSSKILYCCI